MATYNVNTVNLGITGRAGSPWWTMYAQDPDTEDFTIPFGTSIQVGDILHFASTPPFIIQNYSPYTTSDYWGQAMPIYGELAYRRGVEEYTTMFNMTTTGNTFVISEEESQNGFDLEVLAIQEDEMMPGMSIYVIKKLGDNDEPEPISQALDASALSFIKSKIDALDSRITTLENR